MGNTNDIKNEIKAEILIHLNNVKENLNLII